MPLNPEPLVSLPLVVFVVAVACVDLATRRIPNVLTVAAFGLAVVIHGTLGGPAGLLLTATGLLVGLGMMLPLYLTGGFGGGDVKAMAVVGAFLGPLDAVLAVACTLTVGAAAGVSVLIVRSSGRERLQRWLIVHAPIWLLVHMPARLSMAPLRSTSAVDSEDKRFAYGLAIAGGTLITLWWRGDLPLLWGA